MKTIKLSQRQAFELWLRSIERPPIRGVCGKLVDAFGGEKSKLYKEWANQRKK
jgi:hypothetical protein